MGTNPTKIALLIGSLCSFSVIAPAMAADDTSTAKVNEHLVVIGRSDNTPLNIAANVNVIDAAAIEMSGATSVTEVLRGQSGIQISDNNIGTSFAMRGFSASTAVNNTLILLDGRRLNNIDIAAPSLNAIQSSTHSSQIKTVGPAISFLTSCWLFPQKEQ